MSERIIRLATIDFEAAIYARLKGDYPDRQIFVHVPGQNAVPPLIIIGGSSHAESNDTTKTTQAYDESLQIHCWSQKTGNTEVVALANEVLRAITRNLFDLSANQFNHWKTKFDRADFTVESGDEIGLIQHGVISMTFGVEDISWEA